MYNIKIYVCIIKDTHSETTALVQHGVANDQAPRQGKIEEQVVLPR